MQALILRVGLTQAFNESSQRPHEAARSIDQPPIKRIANPAARAAEKIEPLGYAAAGRLARRNQVIVIEEVGE